MRVGRTWRDAPRLRPKRFGAEVILPHAAASVRAEDPCRNVTLADGTELSCHALVLASGMAVKRLEAPGIEEVTGAGVYYGAARSEAASCKGKHVLVVGGANSAGQAAMLFSRYAARVTILVRGESIHASMSRYLVDRIESGDNIEVLTGARIIEAIGHLRLESLRVAIGDREQMFQTSHVFIFIGSAPRSESVQGLVETDDEGFVLTGPD